MTNASNKKRVDLNLRPHPSPMYINYDYGGPEDGEGKEGQEIGPGRGLYNGPLDRYKSIKEFRDKVKSRAYRKRALLNILKGISHGKKNS